MNKKILFIEAIIAFLVVMAFRYKAADHYREPVRISPQQILQQKLILQCSPDWTLLNMDSLVNDISVLPGWGNYRWTISTKNDSAQFYFNQGINLYYAFHIIESMASFKKAESFDPGNAMIYWGQGLAYGPNINDITYSATPDALAATQKAIALSANSTAKEKLLIQAMAVRYSSDSTISRPSLNQLYTDAMKKAYESMTNDADIAALYADAMMLQHPWDYWKHDGKAQPWTADILKVIEKVLKQHPEHPGANHYYIHSVEASPNPQRAIPSAERLGKLMPSVSHMVHMPSHIYIRSGNYRQGIKVNELSVKGYQDYKALFPGVENNVSLYLIHNLHMQTACAMMNANYAYSIKSAKECRASFDTSFMSLAAPLGPFVQYVYSTPLLTEVRYGKWNEILQSAQIPANYVYANALWHWARGMALAKTKMVADAKMELEYLRKSMQHPDMQVELTPFNAPIVAAKAAEKILEGVIAVAENNNSSAIQSLKQAVINEDALIYNEPADWLLPAREYLGYALLKEGSFVNAEKIFRDDLKHNPSNHWSLFGLYRSVQLQKKDQEALKIKKQFDKAFEGADIRPGQSFL